MFATFPKTVKQDKKNRTNMKTNMKKRTLFLAFALLAGTVVSEQTNRLTLDFLPGEY